MRADNTHNKFSIPTEIISQFDEVFIEPDSLETKLAQRILEYFPAHAVKTGEISPWLTRGSLSKIEFEKSKRRLWIKKFKGAFFKRCPGSVQKKSLACCNYHVLNLGQQCNMNCSYCYLQSYLNTPATIIYSNIDQALDELNQMASANPNSPFRVGTGEVVDSLSLDSISLYAEKLIEFFRAYPKWTLEFKTKSANIDHLLHLPHSKNVVFSWSINAAHITETEEHGTASLVDRLNAAKKCVESGFQIAFHIDPIIHYPQWSDGYGDLVDNISTSFSPDQVQVISVGSLRFQPEQRHMMRERFGMKSYVTKAEMFPSEGDKLRYDSSLRMEMLNFVINRFKSKSKDWRIFMCMETPENWISSFDSVPSQIPELKDLFRPLPKLAHETNISDH